MKKQTATLELDRQQWEVIIEIIRTAKGVPNFNLDMIADELEELTKAQY